MARESKRNALNAHLKQRRLGWYVQLAVPLSMQKSVGVKVLTKSLGTRDVATARQRRHAAIAELQERMRAATEERVERPPEDVSAATLLETAIALRSALDAGEVETEDVEASLGHAVDAYLDRRARTLGRDEEGYPPLPEGEVATIRRAYRALQGRLQFTLERQAARYLEESAGHLTAQSLADKRRHIQAFADWFGGDREPAELSRQEAGRYVAEVIQHRTKAARGDAPAEPLSAISRRKELSALRSFFDWLLVRGLTDSNPFDRMASTIRASTRGGKPKRRPWTPAELSKVLRGVPTSDPLWALAAIAAYSGMRREEVAELKVESVDRKDFRIEEGKTAAAVRRVPIHPVVAPLVAQLVKTSFDGYLIPGLTPGGADQKRAWNVGKRFGRVIRKLGVTDPTLDFHALRGTVITQLESAGVPESTIQLIVGHKRQGVTLGVYSSGVPDKVKRDALARVSYGKIVDSLVKAQGASVQSALPSIGRRRPQPLKSGKWRVR